MIPNGIVSYACPYARGKRSRPAWIVRAQPHVRARLRRAFARANQSASESIALSDTPEVARDLAWFLDRWPMEVQAAELLQARADEHREQERSVAEVLAEGYVPPDVPLAIPLRPYQRAAVDLYSRSRSLLLGDDVGLGKTAVAIATFGPATLPGLVVTLAHLPRQWEREIARFAPSLRVKVARTGKPKDLAGDPWDVLIINYHKLRTLAEEVAPALRSVVFDECQELRHPGSAKYEGARHVASQATHRLGLSATPVYNYGAEMWSILDVLAPDSLGTREEFCREWCRSGNERLDDPRAFGLHARQSGMMIRRTRAEVGRELPRLSRFVQEVEADLEELEKVEGRAAELARIILAQGESARGDKMRASSEFDWRYRQATGIAKARPVASFVRMLVESGEKVLLFGWHHEVYGLWKESLADLGLAFFTGDETPKAKEESAARFVSGEAKVLVMSLRAGAGIDGLQAACRTVVFGELDWSPGVHEQAIGRVYRDGQADPVMAYFLVADSGSDPVVSDILGLKRMQSDGILDPSAASVERLEIDPNHVRRLATEYLARKGASHA